MIEALKRFIDRVVKPKRFTDQLLHDAGHAFTALVVALLLWRLFDWPGDLAVFMGWLLPVLLIEGIKDLNPATRFPSPDSLHDIATYLPIQAVWLILQGEVLGGIALFVAIGCSFIGYYHAQFKARWGRQT